MSLKNSNDTIGNRTRDLPVCSVGRPACKILLKLTKTPVSLALWDIRVLPWQYDCCPDYTSIPFVANLFSCCLRE